MRPLHASVLFRQHSTSCTLLQLGSDPNGKCNDNQTPLHLASSMYDKEHQKILLEHKADPDAKDVDGFKAFRRIDFD